MNCLSVHRPPQILTCGPEPGKLCRMSRRAALSRRRQPGVTAILSSGPRRRPIREGGRDIDFPSSARRPWENPLHGVTSTRAPSWLKLCQAISIPHMETRGPLSRLHVSDRLRQSASPPTDMVKNFWDYITLRCSVTWRPRSARQSCRGDPRGRKFLRKSASIASIHATRHRPPAPMVLMSSPTAFNRRGIRAGVRPAGFMSDRTRSTAE